MQYRTLLDLRDELRARLGYAAAGASAGVQQTNLSSFLKQAQNSLYWTHDWARLRAYEDKAVGQDQYLIDYPTTAHPERIKAISIYDGVTYSPALEKGIEPQRYTTQANKTKPYRWEPYAQIELWPIADQAYTARIFFVKQLSAFVADTDRATLDDTMVFLVALADAKDHYRQPDAKRYTDQRDALLMRLKGKSWGKDIFRPADFTAQSPEPLPKPVVV